MKGTHQSDLFLGDTHQSDLFLGDTHQSDLFLGDTHQSVHVPGLWARNCGSLYGHLQHRLYG